MSSVVVIIMILSLCAALIVGGIFAAGFGLTILQNQKKIKEEQEQELLKQELLKQEQELLRQQQTTPQSTKPAAPPPPPPPPPTTKPPTCDRGPQNSLKGYSCPQIEAMNLGNAMSFFGANEQTQFMLQKGIDLANLGNKFPGEVCWSNTIQNCVSPTCLETYLNPKDLAICKIKYMLKDPKYAANTLFDAWTGKATDKYKITKIDLGL